jgi:hypothetical protein
VKAKLLRSSLSICVVLMISHLIWIGYGLSATAQRSKKRDGAQEQAIQFGGTYANLKQAQRDLVDRWYRQYNEITRENLDPEDDYDDLSISVRTTFEAVTHALMTSKLTNETGRSIGTVLDLVSYIETVHGKISEAEGDLQFRVYAALKPAAMKTLENSREFKRGRDNTHYHKGYPINYRQQGGVPSIQISCSEDGKRADIDVDYRSSKFPAAVFNGHLSSSNSDVRAGDNHDRHVSRWSGFANWWKSIFGVPLKEADLKDEELGNKHADIPSFPRAGKGKPEEAMFDFLNSWLVEQQPSQALAYISPRAYSCIDQVAGDEKKQINPGLIPYRILEGMKQANRSIGRPARLADATESVQPNDSALKRIDQPNRAEFDLFEMPDDLAFDFECAKRNKSRDAEETERPRRRYGKYYGASLRLKAPEAKGATLLVIWTKESDYWKIVSWNVEFEKIAGKKAPRTVTARTGAEVKLERVKGDSGLIATVQGFFDDWFVEQNFDRAIGYFSAQCYPCVNLYLDDAEKKARTWQEGRGRVLGGMKKIADVIGRKSEVKDAIKGVTPVHPLLKFVSHSQEEAYTLVSLPNEIAEDFKCTNQVRGAKVAQKFGGTAVYGNYYGALFELRVGGAPASLKLLWGREKEQWKIIAYSVEVP